MKKIAIIPTLLTLGNAICGFAAVVLASKIERGNAATDVFFAYSAWLIIAAMVFDALDGYAARLARTASEFGKELDSLCDAISFGLAPAFLLLRLGQDWGDVLAGRQVMGVVAALYMACTILRLARFNVESSPDLALNKRFKGLPSPAAAGCVASLALLRCELPDLNWPGLEYPQVLALVKLWAPIGALAVALLMVSRVPYPHLTKQMLHGRKNFSHVVRLLLVVCLLVVTRELTLFVLFWGYALSMPIRFVLLRQLRGRSVPGSPPGLEDVVPR